MNKISSQVCTAVSEAFYNNKQHNSSEYIWVQERWLLQEQHTVYVCDK